MEEYNEEDEELYKQIYESIWKEFDKFMSSINTTSSGEPQFEATPDGKIKITFVNTNKEMDFFKNTISTKKVTLGILDYEEKLEMAIQTEEYEQAAMYRDKLIELKKVEKELNKLEKLKRLAEINKDTEQIEELTKQIENLYKTVDS